MTTTSDQIHHAVDQLIQRQRVKVWRDGASKAEWATLPSLWEQLQDATGYRSTNGGGSSTGHWPISGDVVKLVIDMTTAVAEAVHEHAGQEHRTMPGKLRLLATQLMQQDDDGPDWWLVKLRGWVHEARAALRLLPSRPRQLWGVPCPDCGSKKAHTIVDGERVATAALTAEWALPPGIDADAYHGDSEYQLRAITCQFCGACWWRGPGLDQLIADMLHANTTREVMAG